MTEQGRRRVSPSDGGRLGRDVTGLLSIFFCVLVILSLATFDSRDPWLNHVVSGAAAVRNKTGLFGAYIAGFMYDIFGAASWTLPAFLSLAGARRILCAQPWPWWRWTGFIFLAFCVSVAGAAGDLGDVTIFNRGAAPAGSGNISAHGGGILGQIIYVWMLGWLSPAGAFLVWLFSLLLAAQMLSGLSLPFILNAGFVSARALFVRLAEAFSARREERRREPQPEPDARKNFGRGVIFPGRANRRPDRAENTDSSDGKQEKADVPARKEKSNAPLEDVDDDMPPWVSDFESGRLGLPSSAEDPVQAPPVCVPWRKPENEGEDLLQTLWAEEQARLDNGNADVGMGKDATIASVSPCSPEELALSPQTAAAVLALRKAGDEPFPELPVHPPIIQSCAGEDKIEDDFDKYLKEEIYSPAASTASAVTVLVAPDAPPCLSTDAQQGLTPQVQPANQSCVEETAPDTSVTAGLEDDKTRPDNAPPATDARPAAGKIVRMTFSLRPPSSGTSASVNILSTTKPQENASEKSASVPESAPGKIEIQPSQWEEKLPPVFAEKEGNAFALSDDERTSPVTTVAPSITKIEAYGGAAVQPASKASKMLLPSLQLLDAAPQVFGGIEREKLEQKGGNLMGCLNDFGVQGELVGITPGPVVTMFEIRPAPGVRVARISNLSDDLALALKAVAVRIQAPVPGTDTVGIEIPNDKRETVYLRELLDSAEFTNSRSLLTLALGKDIAGHPVTADLASMPHLLVAGATGAGKSVGINSIILSLLYKARPEEVKLLLVDPKRVEMAAYADLPHLVHPVVTDVQLAKNALEWAVAEMERRYACIARAMVRNVTDYNAKIAAFGSCPPPGMEDLAPMPFLVIIIDEFADLMLTAAKEVETSIVRLAQLARAAGIHLVLATQRPSVDVVTGLIKANFLCRIAFQVMSKHDSRTILDAVGAEHLLGKGDMLFKPSGGKFKRLHGAFVSDDNVNVVVDYWKSLQLPDYKINFIEWGQDAGGGGTGSGGDLYSDPMYNEAVEFVRDRGTASISLIQRKFSIGFNKAARLVEQMEADGIIGPADGSKPRKVTG
ncbi:MAG: DNA translocase FtsK [Desulfovibrio sp.]|nr:DNA translocase FtsK [Desulfovibrio sp.]